MNDILDEPVYIAPTELISEGDTFSYKGETFTCKKYRKVFTKNVIETEKRTLVLYHSDLEHFSVIARTEAKDVKLHKRRKTKVDNPNIKRGEWTQEEIDFLKSHFIEWGAERVAKLLNRGVSAIINRASIVGVRQHLDPDIKMGAWDANEDSVIIKEYPLESLVAISEKLKRTIQSIRARASYLEVKRINKRKV
jgi:hypothetical protein